MNEIIIIGKLTMHSFGETSVHDVAWVNGYGVTCSSLLTSNGSLEIVARCLESYLDVQKVLADIPDRRAALEIDGNAVFSGQVELAIKASCARESIRRCINTV